MSVGSSNLQGTLFLLLFPSSSASFSSCACASSCSKAFREGKGTELVTLSLGMYAICVSGGLGGRYYFFYLPDEGTRYYFATYLPQEGI